MRLSGACYTSLKGLLLKAIVDYFAQHRLPATLKPSPRRKTVALQIRQGTLYVRYPARIDAAALLAFIRSRELWIKRHLQVQQRQIEAFSQPVAGGERVWYLGQDYPVHVLKTPQKSQAWFEDDVWHVALSQRLRRPKAEGIKTTLQTALKEDAKRYLEQRTAYWAALTGLQPTEVRVQSFRGLWGRCRRTGQVDLNWRLIFGHADAIDYVIVHELVHLQEFNHSARFWRKVGAICPDFEQWRSYWHARGVWLHW